MFLIANVIAEYGAFRTILGIAFFAVVLIAIIARWITDEPTTFTEHKTTVFKPYTQSTNTSFAFSYVKVPLLTYRELSQYYILKEIADSKGLNVFTKVRLLDLVVPRPGMRNIKGLKARVMSKHVDFVICDKNLYVVAIIELDDSTHLRSDRIKRDQFVDSVLFGAGYRVIHTWSIGPNILDFYQ